MKWILCLFAVASLMYCSSCEKKPISQSAKSSQRASNADSIGPSKTNDKTPSYADGNNVDRVMMTISPNTFKTSAVQEAKVVIHNTSPETIIYAENYRIEFNNVKHWIKLPLFENIAFNDMAYGLDPGRSMEFIINLQPTLYEFKPGNYRVCKEARVKDQKDPSLRSCIEFVVE